MLLKTSGVTLQNCIVHVLEYLLAMKENGDFELDENLGKTLVQLMFLKATCLF